MHVEVKLVDEDLCCHLYATEDDNHFDKLVKRLALLYDFVVVKDDQAEWERVQE